MGPSSTRTCRALLALALSVCLESSVLGYAPTFQVSNRVIGVSTPTTSSSRSSGRGHPLAVSTTARSESLSSDTDMEFAAFAESLAEEPVSSSNNNSNSPTSDQTWQACVDELLDPVTPLSRRQELLAKLVNANQDIQESVLTAMRERKVCLLQ